MRKRSEGTVSKTERRFPSDIANHEMEIVHESGLFRYVRYRNPSTFALWFDITTWPGFLCISGDMGCYVFSRVQDMFEFFRGKGEIDYRYWAEKVQAEDRSDEIMEWSQDEFWDAVVNGFRQHVEGRPKEYRRRLVAVIRETLEFVDRNDGIECIKAMMDLEIDRKCPFNDFYEHNCKDYTYRFVWCCQAIRWGIARYDSAQVLAGLTG